jgi:hypothetical protein
MAAADIETIEGILKGLAGVRDVRRLGVKTRERLLRVESEYEGSSVIPIRNIGVACAAGREVALVVLKDGRFRPPATPTVYMVEELDGRAPGPYELCIEGLRYRVIGEEIRGDPARYGEQAIFLADTFAMFPERRTGRQVPCLFILPPLAFPELDAHGAELGIADVVSISPSIAADGFLRETCGFPRTNDLATLLVGFNTTP